jgi:predicted CXXCH cytochrome family protein
MLNIKEHLDNNPNWHKPIKDAKKEGGCVACHNPHGSNHFSMLKKSYSKKFYDELNPKEFICYKCHKPRKIKTKYTTKYTNFRDGNRNLHFVHAGDKKGRACRACHDEHASKYPHLIRDYTDFNGVKFPLRYVSTKNGGSCQPACHKRFEYDRKNPKSIGR